MELDNRQDAQRAQKALTPALYVIATPIGNLDDMSLRALAVLRCCDAVIAEDSRSVARIFARHRLAPRPVLLYRDDFPPAQSSKITGKIINRLKAGESLALVSDAGTPMVSDPGAKLAAAVLAEGLALDALPGPSAALNAFILSGIAAPGFAFAGFPPRRSSARRRWLEDFAQLPLALILFERPSRLAALLADLISVFGARPAACAREMTKRHQEVIRAPLPVLAQKLAAASPLRGETVLVVAPAAKPARALWARAKRAAARLRGRKAFRLGYWGETLALVWLSLKGFRLLARRLKTRGGEIDMIMRRGRLVIFVEVKARSAGLAQAAEAIRPKQQNRLRRAAEIFLASRADLAGCDMRFDAVLLSGWRLCHIPGAYGQEY